MSRPKITVNTLIRNEQRWIWYALMSVIDLVDEIIVWDTGSSDDTIKIIETINSPKIKFSQKGVVDPDSHTKLRQEMLSNSDCDWLLILDGDEIWYHDSLVSCIDATIQNPHLSGIISPFINLVGDIYHFQDPSRSHYQIGSHIGSYNIRLINRKIPELHVTNPHGRQEYRNQAETAIQNFPVDQLLLVDKPYLHTTHLLRSKNITDDAATLKRSFKYHYELGHNFPKSFVYPEVMYFTPPSIVPSPFNLRSPEYVITSTCIEPIRFAKKLFNIRPLTKGY